MQTRPRIGTGLTWSALQAADRVIASADVTSSPGRNPYLARRYAGMVTEESPRRLEPANARRQDELGPALVLGD